MSCSGYLRPVAATTGFFLLFAASMACADDLHTAELLDEPLQNLLMMEVSSASTYAQKMHDAPSSAIVVTSDDIRTFGYRTLAEVLASMRGLYITNDRSWSYVGVRGFSRSGDYNSRVLLMVDGMRVNDNVFNQAYIGSEFIVDIDLVDRVEFIPGPGASIYGDNAFFGVINVITKKAGAMLGKSVSGEVGSYQSYKGSARYAALFENGGELVMSATALDSQGRDWRYKELGGLARDLDGENYQKLFAKFSLQGLTLEAAHIDRDKQNPTAAFGTVFNDSRYLVTDKHTFISATYESQLSNTLGMRLLVNHGIFEYQTKYPLPTTLNLDQAYGSRNTVDARFTSTAFDQHKIVGGVEYIRDSRLDQVNFDVAPRRLNLKDDQVNDKYGLYLQDEVRLRKDWLVNAGVRYDHYSTFGGTVNPRLALIYQPAPDNNIKLIYGRAFRAPNAYELYYSNNILGAQQKGNTALRPETIDTYELAWDKAWNQNWQSHLGVFHYHIDDLISQQLDPADDTLVFRNVDHVRTRGLELGLEGSLSSVSRLRSSLTYQDARDAATDQWLINSPRWLGKIAMSTKVYGAWQAGTELLYSSKRRTIAAETGSALLVNATLNYREWLPGLDVSIGFYNLFDKRYSDPADAINVQDTIRQDGRTLRIKLDYRF